jgi:predicted ribosome quality control (RQC) complex YloA/Tae2 family protein
MPFDNFVTGAIARELEQSLTGGKIERVYQPAGLEIILHVNVPPRAGGPDDAMTARRHLDLLVSAQGSHPYIYISETKSGNPQNPPAFCMLLRKHLIGARVERVRQVERERIIRMELDASDELGVHGRRTLIFEIMGKHSNIMLLDDRDVVLDSIKRVYADMSRVRQIIPGMAYTRPPAGKGIGPLMESETRTGRPLSYYEDLAGRGGYAPQILTDGDGRMKDFYVFDLGVHDGLVRERCPSVSAMLERYYEEKETGNRLAQKSADLRQILKSNLDKLYLKKQRLLEDIEKARRADGYRRRGDLITANIYRLKQGMKEATLEDYAAEADIRPQQPPTVKIPLDPLLTPAQNAQRYYKKYAKAKTALTEKARQIELTTRDIDFLESYKVYLDNAADAADIDGLREELTDLGYVRRRGRNPAKRSVKKEYLRYESSAGLAIYVGRNNRENDELTLRKARSDDLWLHTKDIPGSHVILTSGADEASVREAAQIAAYYSKARRSESVPVDYCLVKYVKKPAGAKPGMVIFTHNRTLYVTPKLP